VVFKPKAPVDHVPGTIGQELEKFHFKTCKPRLPDSANPLITIRIQVEGELEREAKVRLDANIFEILSTTFREEDFPATDKIKLQMKPMKMQEDAILKFERV
jgi:hypothetical protein